MEPLPGDSTRALRWVSEVLWLQASLQRLTSVWEVGTASFSLSKSSNLAPQTQADRTSRLDLCKGLAAGFFSLKIRFLLTLAYQASSLVFLVTFYALIHHSTFSLCCSFGVGGYAQLRSLVVNWHSSEAAAFVILRMPRVFVN